MLSSNNGNNYIILQKLLRMLFFHSYDRKARATGIPRNDM